MWNENSTKKRMFECWKSLVLIDNIVNGNQHFKLSGHLTLQSIQFKFKIEQKRCLQGTKEIISIIYMKIIFDGFQEFLYFSSNIYSLMSWMKGKICLKTLQSVSITFL